MQTAVQKSKKRDVGLAVFNLGYSSSQYLIDVEIVIGFSVRLMMLTIVLPLPDGKVAV